MDELIKQHYIKHPYLCPFCNDEKGWLNVGDRWADMNIISQRVECYECHKSWVEIYQLTDIEEEE